MQKINAEQFNLTSLWSIRKLKMKSIFEEISVLITFINAISAFKIVPPHGHFDDSPKIWLSEYMQLDSFVGLSADHQFRTQKEYANDFISKNGSDYFVYDDTFSLVFWCRAKYPVKWAVPFPEQLDYMYSYQIQTKEHRESTVRSRYGQIINRAFSSLLILTEVWRNTFFSVNFTCESVSSKWSGRQSSIHLYGSGKQILEKEGETVHVQVSPQIDPLQEAYYILPCRPALPDMTVILEKQVVTDEDHTSWKEIHPPEKYMTFNPKVGFTLDKRLFGSQLFGLYRCRVLVESEDEDEGAKEVRGDNDDDGHIVYVKVQKSYSDADGHENERETEVISRITGDASIKFANYSNWVNVECCTGVPHKKPKDLYVEDCTSPGQCGILKAVYTKSIQTSGRPNRPYLAYTNDNEAKNMTDCERNGVHGDSGLIFCKGDNVEFFSLYFDVLEKGSGNENGNVQTNGHYQSWTSMFHYETEVNVSSRPLSLSEKARLIVGYQKGSKNYSYDYGAFVGGILFRGADSPNFDKVLSTYVGVEDKGILEVVKYDRDFYFEGEKMMFICFAHKFFYAYGSFLRLNWRNHTKAQMLQPIYGPDILVHLKDSIDILQKSGRDTFVSLVSEEMKADLNMKSVDCLIPQWNTTAWDTITYEITVHPSFLPKFEGGAGEEETVYLTLDEGNQVIEFQILESIPEAKVSVSKDGKLLNEGENSAGGFNYTLILEQNEGGYGDGMMNGNNITDGSNKVQITFLQVTHEVQGVYECAAENVKGRVTKRMKVIVAERKSAALAIVGSCIFVLGILFMGFGIWYKCQHKEVRMLRFGITRF